MLPEDKNAVIYGGGGAIGGAVARAFAREGARVFLGGRTLATLEAVAGEISAAGGAAETAQAKRRNRIKASSRIETEEHVSGLGRRVKGDPDGNGDF
jgi:NADP-dependent 3-hydroxy acid dehydrogenase YdfG